MVRGKWGRGKSCAVAAAVRACVEQLEARRLLAAVGPDAYGYTADAHSFESINLVHDAPGVIPLIEGTDDDYLAIDLGESTFNFYGTSYTGSDQLFATSNGTVTFGFPNAAYTNTDFSSGLPERSIAALWDDWVGNDTGLGQVLAKFDDTGGSSAPDRLIIQWNPRHIDGSPSDVKFQAILKLNTGAVPGDIIFNYADVNTESADTTRGATATVGIKDAGLQGLGKLLISNDNASNALIDDGKAILISSAVTGQPHANAGPDRSGEQGDDITLDASGSSDPNQSASSLEYAWDLDIDGVFGETGDEAVGGDETGIHPHYTGPGSDGDGQAVHVTLRVTDSDGHASFDTATVELANQPPTAGISGPATAVAGVPVEFSFTAEDRTQAGDFSFYVDWGDGGSDSFYGGATGTTGSHVYTDSGPFTVSVAAYDNQGAASDAATTDITVGPRPDVLLTSEGVLLVTTHDGNDTIVLDITGDNARLSRNGVVTTYPLADVTRFDVQSGGGNDSITAALEIACSIAAGDGNDTIVTGNSDDSVFGEEGDDSITTADGADNIEAGEGNNTISAGGGPDTISAGEGNDSIDGGADTSEIYSNGGNDTIHAETGYLTAGDGDDTIIGGDGGLNIYPGAGTDSVTTGDGQDVISNEGEEPDIISTGGGDDFITTGGNPETRLGATIDTGSGDDSISGYFIQSLAAGDGDDRITINFSVSIDAGSGDDIVHAGSDADHGVTLIGGDGNDNLFTGDGHDSIWGGAGRDTIHAGGGSDLLSGGGGNDLLFGQGGHDRLYGGNGNDRLLGQGGDDRFIGGAGGDQISGGDGANAGKRDDPLDELTDVQSDLH